MSTSSPAHELGLVQGRRMTCAQSALAGEPADIELICAARGGDLLATETLYTRHYSSAMNVARAIAGHHRADDLTSETFMKVFAVIRRGAGPTHAFHAYLKATMRNAFVDGIRRTGHELLVDSDDLDELVPDIAEELVEQSSMTELLASLPPRWREILFLTVVVGDPLSVAAAKMGLNPNAAAALNFRARAGLMKAYQRASDVGVTD